MFRNAGLNPAFFMAYPHQAWIKNETCHLRNMGGRNVLLFS
jgi:hypothetical protein